MKNGEAQIGSPKSIGPNIDSRALFDLSSLRSLQNRALCVVGIAETMLSGDIPPSQTIYLKNLNEKIKKEGTIIIIITCFHFHGFSHSLFKKNYTLWPMATI